jgi:MFS family permease
VLWSAGSAVQARITATRQRRRGLQAGFLAVAAGIAVATLPLFTALPTVVVAAGWSLAGFGIGLGFPMLSVLTLRKSAPDEQGGNASALQLSDALCSSAVLAVAGALFALAGERGGYGLVLLLAAVVALTGALLARRAFVGEGA